MRGLAPGVTLETEALGAAFPFALLADPALRVAWAGPGILERIPRAAGAPLEDVLRPEGGGGPLSRALLEESLGKGGRWLLRWEGGVLPLAGTWIPAGSGGYLFFSRPDPADAEELGAFSFEDFPWDELPIVHLTTRDEFRNSLDEVQAMAGLLRKRETYLQTLLDSVPLGVILVDKETRTMAGANPYALDLIGAAPEQILGRPCSNFCGQTDAPCPYLDEGEPPGKSETTIRRLDGTTVPVLRSVTVVEMDGREYLLGSILDIRDRKALERRILQAQKMEAVGQLVAGVAHEINTPVQFIGDNLRFLKGAVRDLLEMVERAEGLLASLDGKAAGDFRRFAEERDLDFLEEEAPSALDQSLEGLHRVGRIVEAMKSFSEAETAAREDVDVNDALERALAVSEGRWKPAARIELDLQPDLPPVRGVFGPLEQAFLILIVNAAQAVAERRRREGTEEKGRIRISSGADGSRVEVRVEDDGPGIPAELQARIFDPFFSTKGVGIGSGKGLAYAHTVITRTHGGEIFFETQEGRGTTFVVRLPLARRIHGDPAAGPNL